MNLICFFDYFRHNLDDGAASICAIHQKTFQIKLWKNKKKKGFETVSNTRNALSYLNIVLFSNFIIFRV